MVPGEKEMEQERQEEASAGKKDSLNIINNSSLSAVDYKLVRGLLDQWPITAIRALPEFACPLALGASLPPPPIPRLASAGSLRLAAANLEIRMKPKLEVVQWEGLQMEVSWGGTPFIIHFNRIFHYKSSIFGFPHLWKPPNEKLGGRLNEDPWTAPMALSRACKFFDRAWSLPRLSWPGSRIIMGYHLPSGKHAWQLNILVLMWFEWENNLWMMDFPVPCLTTGGYMFVSIAMFDYQRKTLKRNHVCGLAQPSCSWTVPRFIQLTSGVDCALPFLGWTSKYHWMVLFSFLVKLYFSMALYISTAFSLQCLPP